MYVDQFHIDPKIYALLIKWGKSVGYEVKANDVHTLLYDLKNIDPIRGLELLEEGKPLGLDRDCAKEVVEMLDNRMDADDYDPEYFPPIKLTEDMYNNYFVPTLRDAGYEHYRFKAVEKGAFWDVLALRDKEGELVCRSEVLAMVREIKHKAIMPPFHVFYRHGNTRKTWGEGISSDSAALELMEKEKKRHVPASEWRIYREATKEFGDGLSFIGGAVRFDEWLWLQIWHPGEKGADYWEGGYYEDVDALRKAVSGSLSDDRYAVSAVYVCTYRHAPEEEEEAERPDPFSDATPEHKALMDRFVTALRQNRDGGPIYYGMLSHEVGVLHGLLLLAAVHPGVAQMSRHTHDAIAKFRFFARKCWINMGLSAEDAEMLDTLREQSAEPPGDLVSFKDRIIEALLPVVDDRDSIEQAWPEILKAVAHTWRLREISQGEWEALSREMELALISAHCRGRAGATLEVAKEVPVLTRRILERMRLESNTGTEEKNEVQADSNNL